MEEELLAQIEAAPDDPTPYLIYADLLEQRGDPRGRLIAVQLARAHADTPELALEERKLMLMAKPRRALLSGWVSVTWRRGFWDEARFWYRASAAAPVRDDLAATLDTPAGRLLRALVVSAELVDHDATHAIAAFARNRADHLRALRLSSRLGLGDDALWAVAACTQLERLALSWCEAVTAHGVAALADMTRLSSLALDGAALDRDGAARVAALPLRRLEVSFAGGVIGAFAQHPSLEVLVASELSLDARTETALAAIPALHALVVKHPRDPDTGERRLPALPRLRGLSLPAGVVDDAIADQLAALPALRALALGYNTVTERTLRALRGCRLRALDLSRSRIGIAGVAELVHFQDLEELGLVGLGLGDRVVDLVLQLPKLLHLDLSDCDVSADGLARLAAHPTLAKLGLHAHTDATLSRWERWTHDELDVARY
jgi:uncharacterized protein (TIGR02996 family)